MAHKEKCPYCGKLYVYINRHKCKLEPKEQKIVDIKEVLIGKKTEQASELDQPPEPEIKTPKLPKPKIPERERKKEDLIVESHNETIRFISKFIKPESMKIGKEKEKNVIRDILKNPIESFKFLDKKEANAIKVILMVSNLLELIQYKNQNLYNFVSTTQLKSLEKSGIHFKALEKKIQKAITISSILSQLREKAIKIKRDQQKVIVAGLDRAGKTAILTTFGGKLGIQDLSELRPTKRVERMKIETDELSLFVWDFGGQTKYREDYLQNPGTYFLSVNLLLYVIDCQDYTRFDESFTYLKAILNAITMIEENPHVLVFIHKFDPDLRSDPEAQLNVEFIKENLKDILLDTSFEYEIYLTSIYSVISREPKFSEFLKEMVSAKDLIADPTLDRIDEMSKILNNTLTGLIKLSESVNSRYELIENRFDQLERQMMLLSLKRSATPEPINGKKVQQPAGVTITIPPKTPLPTSTSLPTHGLPGLNPPPPSPVASSLPEQPQQPAQRPAMTLRGSIISELRDLFSQVKRKSI